ncbi:MAG: FecR domain-containing protein [Myxococcota bacterium]
MPDEPLLAPPLRELDRRQRLRGMPPGARVRVAERLRKEAERRAAVRGFRYRWLPALTFAAGAALVLVVVGLGLQRAPIAVQAQAPEHPVLGMFTVEGEGCHHQGRQDETVLDGACRLVAPQLTVQTWERVVLQKDGGIRVVEGKTLFDVEPVPAGSEPVRIQVSHGTIDVIGTRFTIEQGPDGGFVDLFEGKIRFTSLHGEVVDIEPGQRHTWGAMAVNSVAARGPTVAVGEAVGTPDAATPPPPPLDAAPSEHAPERASESSSSSRRRTEGESPRTRARPQNKVRGTTDEAALIIDEVARLRSEGAYARAASVLRRAEQSRRWDSRTAQVLSYELGEILGRHLDDAPAACAHWARHASRFPRGRYARAVESARERLGCSDAP